MAKRTKTTRKSTSSRRSASTKKATSTRSTRSKSTTARATSTKAATPKVEPQASQKEPKAQPAKAAGATPVPEAAPVVKAAANPKPATTRKRSTAKKADSATATKAAPVKAAAKAAAPSKPTAKAVAAEATTKTTNKKTAGSSQQKPQDKPVAKPEAKAEPKPKPEVKPKPAPKPVAKPKPAPKPEAKPEPKAEPKPTSKPAPKPDPKPTKPVVSPHFNGTEYDNLGAWIASLSDGKVYGVRLPKFTSNPSPDGEKTDANKGLVVAPSTNELKGTNDYLDIAAFMCPRVNGYVDDSGYPHVTALEGDDRFRADGSAGDVFVLAPNLYWAWTDEDEASYLRISDTAQEGLAPQPAALLPDGTRRPFMLYPAYVASRDADGKLCSASGRQSAQVSYKTLLVDAAAKGAGYSGKSVADDWYVKAMFLLMFATKSSTKVLPGCHDHSFAVPQRWHEKGVSRVVVSADDAEGLMDGSGVYLQSPSSLYNQYPDLTPTYRITSHETLGDGSIALNLDTTDKFDTDESQLVVAMPWPTGSCDQVQGTCGSPTGSEYAVEPFKLQNIELQTGCSELMGDVLVRYQYDEKYGSVAEPCVVADTASAADHLTDAYVPVGCGLPTSTGEEDGELDAGYQFTADVANASGLLMPQGYGATKDTGTGSAAWVDDPYTEGTRVLLTGGDATDDDFGGLFSVSTDTGLSYKSCHITTRISATGRSRA